MSEIKKLYCEKCIKHSDNCRCPIPKGTAVPQGTWLIKCAGCGNTTGQAFEIVPKGAIK